MTDLGDRVLVLIIVATGLGGLFGWATASLLQLEGLERYLAHVALMVAYFLILIGVWQLLKRIDTQVDEQHTQ